MTVPAPLPVAPPVILSQVVLALAVHGQLPPETVTLLLLPAASALIVLGVTVKDPLLPV